MTVRPPGAQYSDTDDLDERIFAVLREDGRLSNREVARRLDVSEGTVRQRLKRHLDAGAIRIGVVADSVGLGLGAAALVRVSVEPRFTEDALAAFAAVEGAYYVAAASGRFNVLVLLAVRDQPMLLEIVNTKIERCRGVNEVDVRQIVRSLKHNFHRVVIDR